MSGIFYNLLSEDILFYVSLFSVRKEMNVKKKPKTSYKLWSYVGSVELVLQIKHIFFLYI